MDPLVAESLDMACPEPGSPDVNEVEGFVAALFEKEQKEGVERYLDAIQTERQRVRLVVDDMVARPVNYISSLPDEGGFRDRMIRICLQPESERKDGVGALYDDLLSQLNNRENVAERACVSGNVFRKTTVDSLAKKGFFSTDANINAAAWWRQFYPQGLQTSTGRFAAALDSVKHQASVRPHFLSCLKELEQEGWGTGYHDEGQPLGDAIMNAVLRKSGGLDWRLLMQDRPVVGEEIFDQSHLGTHNSAGVRENLNFDCPTAAVAITLDPYQIQLRPEIFRELDARTQEQVRIGHHFAGANLLSYPVVTCGSTVHELQAWSSYSVRGVNPLGWVKLALPTYDQPALTFQVPFEEFLHRFSSVNVGTIFRSLSKEVPVAEAKA